MLLFIWIVLILLGFIVKNSKVIALFQASFAILMITFDTGNSDQLGYINNFLMIKSNPAYILNQNPLFNLLNYIFGVFGQYNIALFFILILSFCFLYKGVSFYTSKISFVFSLYLISPFVIDGTQVRNFVAMCVWVYISKYLYKATIKHSFDRNAWIYLLGVFIVSLIHFSFIFTAIYVFIVFLNVYKSRNIAFIFIGIIFSVGFMKYFMNLMNFLGKSGIESFQTALVKINDYTANYNIGSANARLKATAFFYIIIFIVFLLVYKNAKNNFSNSVYNYYLFIVKLTIVSLPLIFIINYSMEIYRMQRNLLLMYYILFALLYRKKVSNQRNVISMQNLMINVISIVISLFYLLTEAIIWNYDSVFKVMFHF